MKTLFLLREAPSGNGTYIHFDDPTVQLTDEDALEDKAKAISSAVHVGYQTFDKITWTLSTPVLFEVEEDTNDPW